MITYKRIIEIAQVIADDNSTIAQEQAGVGPIVRICWGNGTSVTISPSIQEIATWKDGDIKSGMVDCDGYGITKFQTEKEMIDIINTMNDKVSASASPKDKCVNCEVITPQDKREQHEISGIWTCRCGTIQGECSTGDSKNIISRNMSKEKSFAGSAHVDIRIDDKRIHGIIDGNKDWIQVG